MAVITTEDIRVNKFLDLIGFAEGTSTEDISKDNGYDVLVTGYDLDVNGQVVGKVHEEIFTDYSTHPFDYRKPVVVRLVPRLLSDAAGRYQLMHRYWQPYKKQLHLLNFSPLSQDKIAIQQIKECNAYHLIVGNQIAEAIAACFRIWASFPGNNYGQGGKSLEVLLEKYASL
jgi:muramidase (phage lysozyme)